MRSSHYILWNWLIHHHLMFHRLKPQTKHLKKEDAAGRPGYGVLMPAACYSVNERGKYMTTTKIPVRRQSFRRPVPEKNHHASLHRECRLCFAFS